MEKDNRKQFQIRISREERMQMQILAKSENRSIGGYLRNLHKKKWDECEKENKIENISN